MSFPSVAYNEPHPRVRMGVDLGKEGWGHFKNLSCMSLHAITQVSLIIDGSIYDKKYPNPKQIATKGFQRFSVVFDVLNNILKILENRTFGNVLFSKWRPRWPPLHLNGNKSVIVCRRVVILVSTPWFWRSMNPLRPVRLPSGNQKCVIFKMASNMAAIALKLQ